MVFRVTNAVYSENHTRYMNTHLLLDTECAVKFPNNELCLLNNENVRQTQIEVMGFIVYLMRK
jgi:hypothetical protein